MRKKVLRVRKEQFKCNSSPLDRHKCKKCDFETDFKIILPIHTQIFHKEQFFQNHDNILKQYYCEQCDFESHSVLTFLQHPTQFCDWFDCDLCPFRTNDKTSLNTHVTNQHTLTNFRCYECEHCDFISNRKGALTKHILSDHASVSKNYTCNICNFTARSEISLEKHKSTHSKSFIGKREKGGFCEYCALKTANRSNLKKHIFSKHTRPEDIKWFQCGQCTYMGKSKMLLNRHVHRIHVERKPSESCVCEECGLVCKDKFIYNWHRQREKRKKLGVLKLYPCPYCPHRAKRKDHLQVHLNTIHKVQEKKIECKLCNFKTKAKVCLKLHMKAKHGEV